MEEKENSYLAIFYNEDDMCVYKLNELNFEQEYIETTTLRNAYREYTPLYNAISFSCGRDKLELDPTTMRRIAKFNAEKDISCLIEQKEQIENNIKELKEQEDKYIKKIDSLKEFIKDYIKSDDDDVDNFIENRKYDYDDE
jgi:hypothetical protein